MSRIWLGRSIKLATTSALAIVLAACGGGGGGGSGFNSTPPPPPPPTKTCPDGSVIPVTDTCPPPPTYPSIFPNITTTTDFTVLGSQANALGIPPSSLVSNGFAVRFDAASDAYVIDLPSEEPGKFRMFSSTTEFWNGTLEHADGNFGIVLLDIFKPSPTNPKLQLEFTTFGIFDDDDGFYDYDDPLLPLGVFAFGTATPGSAIPTTGSAVFDAIVAGFTLDTGRVVGGTASLNFNFGTGSLAGSFNPYTFSSTGTQVGLGTYSFVNTVFGVGSTTFSGELQRSGLSGLGAFNGLFTGPAAQELMAKWSAPYLNPDSNQQADMFGVWVGRKP